MARLICQYDFPAHFDEWFALAESNARLLLIASRDMGKSTFISCIYPLWKCIERPGTEVLIISYSEDQVMRIIGKIKELVQTMPGLASLKPKDDADWSKGTLKFSNGSKINSLTMGSSGRGLHVDLIIVDDPVKDYSGMDAEQQEDYFLRALVPMVRPSGKLIVTGTFVYEGDLIERLQKNRAYHTALYPAIKDGKALWPERWPLDKLEERRAEVGDFGFSREYMLERIDPRSQFFKRSMIQYYKPEQVPDRLFRLLSVDPAISLDGDNTALVVTGTGEDKKTLVLDYSELKTDDVQAIVDEIFRLVMAHGIPYIIIEAIGFQKLFKSHLYDAMRDKQHHFGIEEIKSHKTSKQARIMALQPRIAAGSLLFAPTGQESLIAQLCAFPRGKYDDGPDALSFQVGKWDTPGPIVAAVPHNSFEWWKGQVHQAPSDWQKALGV